jgi:signal transduction histidine kinase
MKLSAFIRSHTDEIVREWDRFARTCQPAATGMDDVRVRDHVLQLLMFIARDMESAQTDFEQSEKSKGRADLEHALDSEAETHAVARVVDGFTIDQVVAEFRALRASILHLRANQETPITRSEVMELTRFNECIDQMLSESVSRHTRLVSDVLRDANRQKDEFISTLSHELRNPLSSIRNCVQILGGNGSTDPSVATRVINMLARQTGHLERLLDDLLDVARISRNRVILKIEPHDIRLCVQDAVDANTGLIEKKGHAIKVDVPSAPVTIDVDCTRLAQVVSNLLNNAAKYSPAGSDIEVSLKRETHHAVIRVRDNGIGIDEHLLPHVFDAFYANRAGGDVKQGLGLGLWLSRQLTELQAGTITVDSNGPGTGTEFCVRLPLPAA